jgi:hypothetical protein
MLTLVAVCAVLFFLFSPGVLLTAPPGYKGWWLTEQTSLAAAAVAAVLFAIAAPIVLRLLRIDYSGSRREGFQEVTIPNGSLNAPSKAVEMIAKKHLERAKDIINKRATETTDPATGAPVAEPPANSSEQGY